MRFLTLCDLEKFAVLVYVWTVAISHLYNNGMV